MPQPEKAHRNNSANPYEPADQRPPTSIPAGTDSLDDQGAFGSTHSEVSSTRPRRFLAEPIETSSRSKTRQEATGIAEDREQDPGDVFKKPARRFLPEPIETTNTSHKRAGSALHEKATESPSAALAGSRRFKPDLIETETRSVRNKEWVQPTDRQNPPTCLVDHTNPAPGMGSLASRPDPNNTPTLLPESRFSYSNLLRRQEARRQSFRVPDLPSIPSNSSQESDDTGSVSMLASPPRSPTQPLADQEVGRPFRESYDGDFSEYLLSLAARSAQQQLKEQTLAAFPNEQVYQPVDHFAIDEEDSPRNNYHIKSRRQSSADLSWELEYMRQHKEEAEMRLRAMVVSGNPGFTPNQVFDVHGNNLPRNQSAQKKNGASPPMLGDDIVFPFSLSPTGTICDHAHGESGSQTARAGLDMSSCTGCGSLWYAAPRPERGRGAGLWMGTCRKDEDRGRHVAQAPPGIMTPTARHPVKKNLTPGLSCSNAQLNRFTALPDNIGSRQSAISRLEKTIADELHDGFVTQIYNYLSLGYPCLARYYDYELSRISGIPIEDLRRDDLYADAKGYVVAPGTEDLTGACARWRALRLYIHEWGRQQPSMAGDEPNLETWGVPERRGSWAG